MRTEAGQDIEGFFKGEEMGNIVLLDGAGGTCLWAEAEKNGIEKVATWIYNIEHPELVASVEKQYLEAGSQVLLTNTFAANRPTVERVSKYSVPDVVKKGVEITKSVVAGTDVKVCLSIGPLPMLMEPYGDLEEDECRDIYEEMINAGVEAGSDMILFETFIDLAMLKVAVEAGLKKSIPVIASMSFEKVGKTIMGNSVDDMVKTLEPMGVTALGMNCSLGPDISLPIVKEFYEKASVPVFYKPNAGMPVSGENGALVSSYSAEDFAKLVEPALQYVGYIGACSGSDPSYISAIKKLL